MWIGSYGMSEFNQDNFDASRVNYFSQFMRYNYFKTIDLSHWDVSNVSKLDSFLQDNSMLESVNLTGWDVSNVTNTNYMFSTDSKLTDLIGFEDLDFKNLTQAQSMFERSGLQTVDLSDWNTPKLTNVSYMFNYCKNLKSVDLSNWNTSLLNQAISMFNNDTKLETVRLDNWYAPVSASKMFIVTENPETAAPVEIYVGSNWNPNRIASSSADMYSGRVTLVGKNDTEYSVENDTSSGAKAMSRIDCGEDARGYLYGSTFDVVFHGNGGSVPGSDSGEMRTQHGSYYMTLTVANNAYIRDGYRFTGFYTEPECINLAPASYVITNELPATTKIDLYAGWKDANIVCKITDENNNLLTYNGQDAVFGQLNDAFNASNSTLYNGDTPIGNNTTIQIKMIVPEYDMIEGPISANNPSYPRHIVLTTAGRNDADGYPYQPIDAQTLGQDRSLIKRTSFNGDMFTRDYGFSVKNIKFDGGSTLTTPKLGRAINVTAGKDTVVTGAQFSNFANNHDGGVIFSETDNLLVNGGIFNNSTITDCSGGTIYTTSKSVSLINVSGNNTKTTSKNGGFIYMEGTEALTITGGNFINCSSINMGGAISLENPSENATVDIQGVSFDTCSSRSGGALRTIGIKSLTINGSSFRNCFLNGASLGGAIFTDSDYLSIKGTSFSNCVTASPTSGAAAIYYTGNSLAERISGSKKAFVLENSYFNNCKADGSGAIKIDIAGTVEVSKTTFQDCAGTAPYSNGGAISVSSDAKTVIKDSTKFINCSAGNVGGAIYAAGMARSNNLGSAVEPITIEKTVQFINCSAMFGGAIRTQKQLIIDSGNAAVADYVTFENCYAQYQGGAIAYDYLENNVSPYKIQEKFENIINKAVFTNNSSGYNGGAIYFNSVTDDHTLKIMTVAGNCNYNAGNQITAGDLITNARNGGFLYVNAGVVTFNGGRVSIGDFVASENGGAIYLRNGRISMETTFDIDGWHYIPRETNNAKYGGAIYNENGVISILKSGTKGTFRDCSASEAGGTIYNKSNTIQRFNDEFDATIYIEEMFMLGRTEDIITDSSPAEMINYYHPSAKRGGGMFIENGIVMIDSHDYSYSSIGNNTASINGGGAYIASGAVLDLKGRNGGQTEFYRNYVETLGHGAGIYCEENSVLKLGGTVFLGTNDDYSKNTIKYNAKNTYKPLSRTSEYMGASDSERFAYNADDIMEGQKNGNANYPLTIEDIYLEGYADSSAASIVVTDAIPKWENAFYVYAEQSLHYLPEMQFAKIETPKLKARLIAEGTLDDTLHHFRNARSDADTENPFNYFLYGISENDADPDNLNVVWIGKKRMVVIDKIDPDSNYLSGAVVDICNEYKEPLEMKVEASDGTEKTITFADLESTANGILAIGKLPYGTWLIHEKQTPAGYNTGSGDGWYRLRINASGVTVLEN